MDMNANETTIVSRLSLDISGFRPGWFFSAFTWKAWILLLGCKSAYSAYLFAMIAFVLGEPAGERLAAVIDPDAPGRLVTNVFAISEITTENLRRGLSFCPDVCEVVPV
jgi:hypothetical protein